MRTVSPATSGTARSDGSGPVTGPMEATTSAPPERTMVVHLGDSDARDGELVAAALEQFTPLSEALRPGLHAFGARGPSRYFGGERALAELVARAAAKAVPSASRAGVGVADGLFAAGLAAQAASRTSGTSTARAPAAETFAAEWSGAGHSVSTAVVVVPPQQGRQFLASLPLISLLDPISPLHSGEDGTEALLDVLWRLGIRTLGDLAALSEADVLGRFGWPGLLAHRLACGLDDRPLQASPAPDDSAVEAEIDPPADRIETVAFMARALADDMVARLARYGLDCVCIDIEAESDSGHASNRRWRHELRFSAADIVDRVRWQLEGWYRSPERPTGPVVLIRITPCVVAPADGRQLGMWGARSEADERAAKALARLQGLLGAEAVTVPRLAGGRRPADTGRRVPLHAAEAGAGPAQDPSTADVNRGNGRRSAKTTRTAATRDRKVKGRKSAKTTRTAATRDRKVKGRKSAKTTRTAATRDRKVKAGKTAKPADAPWPGRLPAPQPAVVLTRPEPITVTDRGGDPVTVSGRGEVSAAPWQVTDSTGRSQAVVAWAGPWPLDERWWRPSARRRQARFQLVLNDGSAHLCVLEAGRWRREAIYD